MTYPLKELRVRGELHVLHDGSTIVGSDDLNGLIYEWCNGYLEDVEIVIRDASDDISDEGDV